MYFLILRNINKRHSSLKIKTDHRKWPFVIKTLVKVCFFSSQNMSIWESKDLYFQAIFNGKKYKNNEK